MSIDSLGSILVSLGVLCFSYSRAIVPKRELIRLRMDKIDKAIKRMNEYRNLDFSDLSIIPYSSTGEILSGLDPRDADIVKSLADKSINNLIASPSVAYYAFIPHLEHIKIDRHKEIQGLGKREKILNYIWPIFIFLGIMIQLIR